MSLSPSLLAEFDKSMKKAGFSDRSKAIQNALHAFIDENSVKSEDESAVVAGAILMLYDNHAYNHDAQSTHTQHDYNDIISASTHTHLDHDNCLETIMVKGEIGRIKQLAQNLSENRGIKSLKMHVVSLV